jgi:hypothetical protein
MIDSFDLEVTSIRQLVHRSKLIHKLLSLIHSFLHATFRLIIIKMCIMKYYREQKNRQQIINNVSILDDFIRKISIQHG